MTASRTLLFATTALFVTSASFAYAQEAGNTTVGSEPSTLTTGEGDAMQEDDPIIVPNEQAGMGAPDDVESIDTDSVADPDDPGTMPAGESDALQEDDHILRQNDQDGDPLESTNIETVPDVRKSSVADPDDPNTLPAGESDAMQEDDLILRQNNEPDAEGLTGDKIIPQIPSELGEGADEMEG